MKQDTTENRPHCRLKRFVLESQTKYIQSLRRQLVTNSQLKQNARLKEGQWSLEWDFLSTTDLLSNLC